MWPKPRHLTLVFVDLWTHLYLEPRTFDSKWVWRKKKQIKQNKTKLWKELPHSVLGLSWPKRKQQVFKVMLCTMVVFVDVLWVRREALGKFMKKSSFPLWVAGPHSSLLRALTMPFSYSKSPAGHPSKPACSQSNPHSKIMSSCPLLSKQKVCLLRSPAS